MPNPVVHFEIISQKPEQAKKFYAEIFGWKMTPVQDIYTLVGTKSPGQEHGIDGGIGNSQGGPNHIDM